MKQPKGLGRGLDAILSSEKIEKKITPMSKLTEIPLDKISPNPTQPRQTFDEELLAELAASIKELGIIQPITLKPTEGGRYIIISGERRWRASQVAGIESIPAYIREVDDEAMHAMALVENLQREDLNPIEIALGLQRLIEECSLTQESLAQKVAIKRSSISNYLRLLKLSNEVQYALKQGAITMGHAKAIASLGDRDRELELLYLCIEKSLSVREAEALVAQPKATTKSKTVKSKTPPAGFERLSSHLGEIFSRGVEIKKNSRGGGRIVINFTSQSEIEQFVKELQIES